MSFGIPSRLIEGEKRINAPRVTGKTVENREKGREGRTEQRDQREPSVGSRLYPLVRLSAHCTRVLVYSRADSDTGLLPSRSTHKNSKLWGRGGSIGLRVRPPPELGVHGGGVAYLGPAVMLGQLHSCCTAWYMRL